MTKGLFEQHTGGLTAVSPQGDSLFRYNVGGGLRPHIHPLHPFPGSDAVLTRWRPWDHPWHFGIFTGHLQVNGFDFWSNDHDREPEALRGRIEYLSLQLDTVAVCRSNWCTPEGKVLLIEEQRLGVPELGDVPVDSAYWFDFDWILHAQKDLKFGKYPYGGLTCRLDGWPQTVRWLTAESAETVPMRHPQIASKWVAIANRIDRLGTYHRPPPDEFAYAGIAVLDHPNNPGHPVSWCGDQTCVFLNAAISERKAVKIASGSAITFRYRMVVFTGLPKGRVLEALWQKFEQST